MVGDNVLVVLVSGRRVERCRACRNAYKRRARRGPAFEGDPETMGIPELATLDQRLKGDVEYTARQLEQAKKSAKKAASKEVKAEELYQEKHAAYQKLHLVYVRRILGEN